MLSTDWSFQLHCRKSPPLYCSFLLLFFNSDYSHSICFNTSISRTLSVFMQFFNMRTIFTFIHCCKHEILLAHLVSTLTISFHLPISFTRRSLFLRSLTSYYCYFLFAVFVFHCPDSKFDFQQHPTGNES